MASQDKNGAGITEMNTAHRIYYFKVVNPMLCHAVPQM